MFAKSNTKKLNVVNLFFKLTTVVLKRRNYIIFSNAK